jgi:hypothetical protein
MLHNKDAAAPVPDCHIPAIRREFRRILFCKTRAGPPLAVQSTNSNADNSGQIHRKSRDFSRAISRCMRWQPRGTEKDVFVAPPPAVRATAQHCHRTRASFVQKQSPARAAGLFTCELRRV